MRVFAGVVAAIVSAAVTCGAAVAEHIRGTGSTFAAPLVNAWAQIYRKARTDGGDFTSPDWTVDYEAVGSSGGIVRIADPFVDFAATDAPLSAEELAKAHRLAERSGPRPAGGGMAPQPAE